jgi:hypothetical protein
MSLDVEDLAPKMKKVRATTTERKRRRIAASVFVMTIKRSEKIRATIGCHRECCPLSHVRSCCCVAVDCRFDLRRHGTVILVLCLNFLCKLAIWQVSASFGWVENREHHMNAFFVSRICASVLRSSFRSVLVRDCVV